MAGLVLLATACGGDGVERRARAELRQRLAGEAADSTIRSLYAERKNELLWVETDGLTNKGRRVVEAIGTAHSDGLDSESYGIADAHAALEVAGNEELSTAQRAAALADAELALTGGLTSLLRDLERGATQPSEVQPAWRIDQPDTPEAPLLEQVVADGEPEQAMANARPAVEQYALLRDVLARLRDVRDAGGWPEVPDRRIRAGADDDAVATLRARLSLSVVEGERADAEAGRDRPTHFDERLDRALRAFQERHGLEVDGEVDAATVTALNVPVEERVRAVELNLERWRWMPHDLGARAVLVNIAGYDMRLLEDGRPVLHMKTVVGRPAWRTPIFADTMTHMIVHPYWNVPESILVEELLPSARQDAGYLIANNYEVVDGEGRLVDGDFDLEDLDPELGGGLRVRQKPGAGNALGQVKFMFPNNENVYLHDTPAKSLFERTSRALSHGCVRVERPLDLARFLAEWTGGDQARFERALAGEENARIDLPRSVRVYLAYFTVWVEPDGRPRFLADPYELDREMTDLLLATSAGRLALAGGGVRTSGG